MRIFLTGFMGAGKTTVGRLLADRLGVPFVDLDHDIEAHTGLTVRQIFAEGGEARFRQLEREALAGAVRAHPAAVISTGGGTVTHEANLRLMKAEGLVVWLHPDFATLARRIGRHGKGDRPLFQNESQALDLYRQRLPAYQRAHLELPVRSGESAREVAARAEFLVRSGRTP